MKKDKTMSDIYFEIKELRKNPTPDNIEKINDLIGFRDSLGHSLANSYLEVVLLILILFTTFLFVP